MKQISSSSLNFQTAPSIALGVLAVVNCAYGISSSSKPSVAYSVCLAAATYFAHSSPKAGALFSAALLAKFSWDIGLKAGSQKKPDLAVISTALFCGAVYCAYRSSQF